MESSLFIKICGITNRQDAEFVVKSGADAIGFITYPKSPRYILPGDVKEILDELHGESIRKVGVFVDASEDEIKRYIDVGINTVQLHGNETAETAEKYSEALEVWKVIKPESTNDIERFSDFPADKFLLDAFHKELHGGTGLPVNREIAKFAVENLPAPVIIAGGVSSENCIQIRDEITPFGLDVNSGVEISPGIKDHGLLIEFFKTLSISRF